MNDLLEFGKSVLKEQPFSSLLGAELTALESGSAEITLAVREEFKQQHGFVHGGVISYLMDNCLTYAGGSMLGNSVTSEYKINYVRPAIGHKLIARATVLSIAKQQAVCECKVFALGEKGESLVAVALGTIIKMELTKSIK
ncbi:MAG: PaaI family thioesterase [Gammaproteobacteria bacterium]|nr:MAG: PaaI family thioesterase [Gammaproteobacteria bacterium]